MSWFQGREELGQRALGNRSILANPAIKEMKNTANQTIEKASNSQLIRLKWKRGIVPKSKLVLHNK